MSNCPIILTAFGTSTEAKRTYEFFDERVKEKFPDADIFWSFTSGKIKKKLESENIILDSPEEVLKKLGRMGYKKAVIQSLHVICGVEFQKVISASHNAAIKASIGKPLLGGEEDFENSVEALSEMIANSGEWATVFVGHGTYHPAGSAYMKLDNYLKLKYPRGVHVSVIEGMPSWEETLKVIKINKIRKIKFVPLMFVAGEHIISDVLGEGGQGYEQSWKSQLEGFEVDCEKKGLGFNKNIIGIYIQHIEDAMKQL